MKNSFSFILVHLVVFLFCMLFFFSGCGSIEGTRVEVQTTTPNVWDATPAQSVSVKVVRTL